MNDQTKHPDSPFEAGIARWLELGDLLAAAARMLRQSLADCLEVHQVNEGQLSVLWACQQAPGAGGLGQIDLAARLSLSPAMISGLVEQLRQRGLLEGRRSPEDRRRQIWTLTAQGEELLAQLRVALRPWLSQVELALPGASADELAAVLRHWLVAARPARQEVAPARGQLRGAA